MDKQFNHLSFQDLDEEEVNQQELFAQQQDQLTRDPLKIGHLYEDGQLKSLETRAQLEPLPKYAGEDTAFEAQDMKGLSFKKPLLNDSTPQFPDLNDKFNDGDEAIVLNLDADGDQHTAELQLKLTVDKSKARTIRAQVRHQLQTEFIDLGTFETNLTDPRTDFYIENIVYTDGTQRNPTKIFFHVTKEPLLITPPDLDNHIYHFYLPGKKMPIRVDVSKLQPDKNDTYARRRTIEVMEPPNKKGIFWEARFRVGGFQDWMWFRIRPKGTEVATTIEAEIYVAYYHGSKGLYNVRPITVTLPGVGAAMQLQVVKDTGVEVWLNFHKNSKTNIPDLKLSHSLQALDKKRLHYTRKKTTEELRNPAQFAVEQVHMDFKNRSNVVRSHIKYEGQIETAKKLALPPEYLAPKRDTISTKDFKRIASLHSSHMLRNIQIPGSVKAELEEMDFLSNIVAVKTAVNYGLISQDNLRRWVNFATQMLKLIHQEKQPAISTLFFEQKFNSKAITQDELNELAESAEHFLNGFSEEIGDQPWQHQGTKGSVNSMQGEQYTNVFLNPYFRESITEVSHSGGHVPLNRQQVDKVGSWTKLPNHPALYQKGKVSVHYGNRLLQRSYHENGVMGLPNALRNGNWTQARKAFRHLWRGYQQWVADRIKGKAQKLNKNSPQKQHLMSLANVMESTKVQRERLENMSASASRGVRFKKIKAVFYGHNDMNLNTGTPQGVLLNIYYYREYPHYWHVINLTSPSQKRFERTIEYQDAHGKYPPRALFEKLLEDKFPKGVLYYQVPGGVGGELEFKDGTLSAYDYADWLKVGGIVLGLLSMAIPGGQLVGLSEALGILGTIMVGAQGVWKLTQGAQNDNLDAMTVASGVLDVAASIYGVLATVKSVDYFLKANKGYQAIKQGEKAYIGMRMIAAQTDAASFALTTYGTLQKLKGIVDSKVPWEEKWRDFVFEITYYLAQGKITFANTKTFGKDTGKIEKAGKKASLSFAQKKQQLVYQKEMKRIGKMQNQKRIQNQQAAKKQYHTKTDPIIQQNTRNRSQRTLKNLQKKQARQQVLNQNQKKVSQQQKTTLKESKQLKQRHQRNQQRRQKEEEWRKAVRRRNAQAKTQRDARRERQRKRRNQRNENEKALQDWRQMQQQYYHDPQHIKKGDPEKDLIVVVVGNKQKTNKFQEGKKTTNKFEESKKTTNKFEESKKTTNSFLKKLSISSSQRQILRLVDNPQGGHVVQYQGGMYKAYHDSRKGWFFNFKGKRIYLHPQYNGLRYNARMRHYEMWDRKGGGPYPVNTQGRRWTYHRPGEKNPRKIDNKDRRQVLKQRAWSKQARLIRIEVSYSFRGKPVTIGPKGGMYTPGKTAQDKNYIPSHQRQFIDVTFKEVKIK